MAKRSGGTRARMPASYKYAPNFASHTPNINQKVKINREKTIVTKPLSSSRVKDKDAFDKYHGYTKIG